MNEHVENRNGVYYIPGIRISLDSIVYAFRQGLRRKASGKNSTVCPCPMYTVLSRSTWTIRRAWMSI